MRTVVLLLILLIACAGGLVILTQLQHQSALDSYAADPYYSDDTTDTTEVCGQPEADATIDAIATLVDGTGYYRDAPDATTCEDSLMVDAAPKAVTATLVKGLRSQGWTVKTRAPDEFVDHTQVLATGRGGQHVLLDVEDDGDGMTDLSVSVTRIS